MRAWPADGQNEMGEKVYKLPNAVNTRKGRNDGPLYWT